MVLGFAYGIVDTEEGWMLARRTRFSRLFAQKQEQLSHHEVDNEDGITHQVLDTHITLSMSERVNCKILFM